MSDVELKLFDENMERALLKSIILDNDVFYEVHDILTPDDFYVKTHKDVYLAMRKCDSNEEQIDEIFLKKYLDKYDETLFEKILEANPIINVSQYANSIRDFSMKRALLKIASSVPSKISQENNAIEVADNINGEIFSLVSNLNAGKIKETEEIIGDLLEEYKKIKERGNGLSGISTGYSELDYKTKGFKGGELIVIAARSGMGKTTFALNLAEKILLNNGGVVFFSLEMGATELMFRLLSSNTSIPLQDIRSANLDDGQWGRFNDACEMAKQWDFFVYDSREISLHQVRSQMLKLMRINPQIKACIIDYIGLMNVSANYKERHLQVAEISRGLKLLARELNIPIIILAQLNRNVESRANHKPMLSDLRESGAIEQDADLVLFVYREERYKEMERSEENAKLAKDGKDTQEAYVAPEIETATIIIGKNRNGPLGDLKVYYNKAISRFADPESSGKPIDTKISIS